jgi:hypothetical protein
MGEHVGSPLHIARRGEPACSPLNLYKTGFHVKVFACLLREKLFCEHSLGGWGVKFAAKCSNSKMASASI